ncbi:MAG: DUF5709 domain-containing protein [Propionibacteriaceae bacterium]|jgi:hypothetical protein|nr:DUF5709 domain-containing protein [Propionibacteriaceae bacterium]
MSDYAVEVPDGSEQLDQLQPDETLLNRGVEDVLDEGYVTPENWSPAQGFGNTPAEMRRGETIDQRVLQEQSEPVKDDAPWNPDPGEKREVGNKRAGRLVDAAEGSDGVDNIAESVGRDVGIAGGAASAEEAAMHIIDDYDDDDD